LNAAERAAGYVETPNDLPDTGGGARPAWMKT